MEERHRNPFVNPDRDRCIHDRTGISSVIRERPSGNIGGMGQQGEGNHKSLLYDVSEKLKCLMDSDGFARGVRING